MEGMNNTAATGDSVGMMIRVRGKWISLRAAEAKASAAQGKPESPGLRLRLADNRRVVRIIR